MTAEATHAGPVGRKSLEPWILDSVLYYPHQIEGVRELAKKRSFLLADDMGLGKSIQALTVFTVDVARGWAQTCIVVCPVTLKGNWADEIEKFTRFPYVVLNGSPAQRQKQLQDFEAIEGPKVLIVNYEQVTGHLAQLDAFQFDVAIFDEAHYLKNHKAKRTQSSLSLYSRRSFMLTGTPMLNHVNELWSILHRISPSEYPKYWTFLNRYAVFGGYKDKQIVGVKNEKELTERLQKVMLRRLKKDVLDLPEVQIIEKRVDLTDEQRKIYNEVVEDMRLVRPDEDDDEDIENALTKFLRLKQICGTTKPFTGTDVSSKLDLAVDDAIEILENGHKLVVFTQFRDVQECFADRLDKAAPAYDIWTLHGDVKMNTRVPIVNEWSHDRKPGVIVCMLQVAGIGLNMTAARHAFFLDKLFVPGLNRQAIDRLHRIGQDTTQPVQIFEYICRNTIENRVNQILRVKSKLFGEIVEADPNWKRKLLKAIMEDDA
jgi:SNF2 family DNA or RNA helicase